MTCLGSGCFELRTEGSWVLLDGSTTCEHLEAIPQDLSVSPGCRVGKTSESAMFGKNPSIFTFLHDLSFFPYFLAQQNVLLFSLHRAILQVCVAALPSSPRGCFQNCIRSAARASCQSWGLPHLVLEHRRWPKAFLNVDMDGGMGGLNLSKVSSLGCSLADTAPPAQVQYLTISHVQAYHFLLLACGHFFLPLKTALPEFILLYFLCGSCVK